MSVTVAPPAPYGSAFSPFVSKDIVTNLLGSIPILGIYIGYKRICAVSAYIGSMGDERKVARVIVRSLGDNVCQTESTTKYKVKHYIRGIMEIAGLGLVVTIIEIFSTFICFFILALGYLLGLCLLILYHPIDFLHHRVVKFFMDWLESDNLIIEEKPIQIDNTTASPTK
ncbi:hypothetical protein [Chlamydia sp. 17-3921]|uniref:hypothetical protein n=1 Tax=Chlamydia sp. 17-3921 TaxID=2675798 RepID=UPI00191B39CF|nr:hypothetical protein [Chlamydia sp. 17-3921]